jgi:hypothetical protein
MTITAGHLIIFIMITGPGMQEDIAAIIKETLASVREEEITIKGIRAKTTRLTGAVVVILTEITVVVTTVMTGGVFKTEDLIIGIVKATDVITVIIAAMIIVLEMATVEMIIMTGTTTAGMMTMVMITMRGMAKLSNSCSLKTFCGYHFRLMALSF